MRDEETYCPVKKSSYGLPVGTTVKNQFFGTAVITHVFDLSAEPQYSLLREDGKELKAVHQSNVEWVADPKPAVSFQKGDRVRFRHNGKCGTATHVTPNGIYVEVMYDGETTSWEIPEDLTLIHSPAAKAVEGPHPMQKAIDVIEEERRTVGLQITALQRRSRELKKAKELLVRGV